LQAAHPDYTEERRGRYLYFWGEYPHWVITNEMGKTVLHALFKGAASKEVSHLYQEKTGLSHEEAAADLHQFLTPLIEVGVVYEEGCPPRIPAAKAQFSVDTAVRHIASVVLNPTHRCNYACAHCYTDGGQPLHNELSVDEMISILKDISPFMHAKILGFLGGEPLLRKQDVLTVAEYWIQKEKGSASVSTNGSLLDVDFAQKAAALTLAVQISMDGSQPHTCDAVRGKGSFAKAVAGASLCVKSGAPTWLCMVYHTGNIHELEDFIALGIDLGVSGVRFIPYNYLGRGSSSTLVKVMPYHMVKAVHTILRTHPEWGDFIDQSFFGNISVIVRSAPRYVYCGSGLSTLLVESNGDLYPCINLKYPEFNVGNLREHTFSHLWVTSPVLKEMRSLCVEDSSQCSHCAVKYLCGMGCRSEIYELTRRIRLPTFFCESWKKSVFEMCWILDEFPHLHQKVTQQRQAWTSQSESLVPEVQVQQVVDKLAGDINEKRR
jgi:radical SAM protein with 4Fe4S-binding SPASM domain